jgi:hypothetical protein
MLSRFTITRQRGLFSLSVVAVVVSLATILLSICANASSSKPLPILFILLEIGPGAENDFHPWHDLDFYRGRLDGSSSLNQPVQATVINYSDSPGGTQGHFPSDSAFPRGNGNHFAIHVKATLDVSSEQTGPWTFGVNSDDGSQLLIDDKVVIEDDAVHPARDTFGTITLTSGLHTLELVYFDCLANATVELFAAPGTHASFNSSFQLISYGSGPGLHVTPSGFEVNQRFVRQAKIDRLAAATALLSAPFHNIVDYFSENSYSLLKLVPATQGDIDGTSDGIVGPYQLSELELEAEPKRSKAIQAADPHFDFSFYDAVENGGNGNGVLEENELLVVVIAGQADGNEHSCTLLDKNDFDQDSFQRVTVPGMNFDVTQGRLVGQTTFTPYQRHYYARQDNPARQFWTANAAKNDCDAQGGEEFQPARGGANVRELDTKVTTDDGVIIPKSFDVAGAGQWAGWMNLAHEISHLISSEARDLYNFRSTGGYHVGLDRYDVMASGGSGTTHHNPWTKMKIGWVNATVVSSSGPYTLNSIESSPDVLQIKRSDQEYLLIENRWRGSSYDNSYTHIYRHFFRGDSGIPGEGLAIYHIDETRLSAFNQNDFGWPPFIRKVNADGTPESNAHDLWDGSKSFQDHLWNDGTPSGVGVTCISPPGSTVKAYVDFSTYQYPFDDRFEPNNDESQAKPIAFGSTNDLTIQASCDKDFFKFKIDDYSDITVETAAYFDGLMEQPAPGPELTLWRDDQIVATGQGSLSPKLVKPGTLILETSSSNKLYYNIKASEQTSKIDSDRFDDQTPPGEPRNDNLQDATLVELKQDPMIPSPIFHFPYVIKGGGRTATRREKDLNFDRTTDIDFFKIKIDLVNFAYSLGSECPSDPLTLPSSSWEGKAERGRLRVTFYPELNGPLEISLHDSSGKLLQPAPFISKWSSSWTSGVEIDCPSSNLGPNWDGILIVSAKDPDNRRNFYDMDVSYRETQFFARDRDFLIPVWELEDIKFITPTPPGPLRFVFPFDPMISERRFGQQSDELPADLLGFVWPETTDFVLTAQVNTGKKLTLYLLDMNGVPIDEPRLIKERQRIFVPGLQAGVYVLKVSAEALPTFYSLEFGSAETRWTNHRLRHR